MSIVAFWSNEEKETGQTMSMVALSTYMAIEHNYRMLNVSTSFGDRTLEKSYWYERKSPAVIAGMPNNQAQLGLENGIEGLVKIISSNKTATGSIANYTKVVFRDRLDVLCAPKATRREDYNRIAQMYPTVLQTANKNYDFVFVDVSKDMPQEQSKQILELADVIVVNITQKLEIINNFIRLKEANDFFKKNNIMINMGRYDRFSKYNVKNVSRYMKLKRGIYAVPYNTLFFEACSEGSVAELFLRFKRLESEDNNTPFIKELSVFSQDLIYKVQELQMKM